MFLPLGLHPLANGFLTSDQLKEAEAVFSLDTYVCLDCGLIQIKNNVPPNFFRQYVYVPSASEQMQRHFEALAETVAAKWLPSREALAVDIGCNDGLFLKSLKGRGARTLGIDPATNIVEIARQYGLEIFNEYFNPAIALKIKNEYGSASVVVSTNTFHHVDDLDSFTEGVAILLDGDGVFIIEVPHALELVKQNEFDGIYHEHVSQLTVKSFVDLFRRFDLEVFDVERLDVHGGSIRVFARKTNGQTFGPTVRDWISEEQKHGMFFVSTYDCLRERVRSNKAVLLKILYDIKASGKRIVGYGASARGNTLLNYYGIGPDLLDYLVDKNTLKHGLYTPGMHIPVFSPEKIVTDMPDYLLLLAWNFADEIIDQQAEYRKAGGRFIVPIPEPAILDN